MEVDLRRARLTGATFRANPGFELLLFDRLPLNEQVRLAKLREDPEFYGILRPRPGSGLRTKAVNREVALLYLTLGPAGPLPAYMFSDPLDEIETSVAQLVLDAVLEIESGGAFVSGAAAHAVLHPTAVSGGQTGVLAQLSEDAVRYGAVLDIANAIELSVRLYSYNRMPISPSWRQRFPSVDAVRAHWHLDEMGRLGGNRFERVDGEQAGPSWITWRSSRPWAVEAPLQALYKLYVSPHPDHVRTALAETVAALAAVDAPCFKVGGDLPGLLRPDKLVCYFAHLEQLQQAAALLADAIEGMPAHGVPFTAALVGSGLISWGLDPSADRQAFGWLGRQSWRLWITNHLASSLLAAKAQPGNGLPAWRFALDRLRLEGVDIETWAPRVAIPPSFLEPRASKKRPR